MATMNSILRLRQAFRSTGAGAVEADEAADAIDNHAYGRRESDLKFQHMLAEVRRDMAEFKTQVVVAIMVATSLIIGAIAAAVALLASID